MATRPRAQPPVRGPPHERGPPGTPRLEGGCDREHLIDGGDDAIRFHCALGAAKAALDAYSRTLAVELAPSGVRVNVVSPGPVSTPSSDAFPGISGDDWLKYVPLGRLGTTDDLAEIVALLTSDGGGWLTGANYRVDGGMTARCRPGLHQAAARNWQPEA